MPAGRIPFFTHLDWQVTLLMKFGKTYMDFHRRVRNFKCL